MSDGSNDWFRDPAPRASGQAGYRNPGAWPEQPPAHAGSGGRRSPQYQGGRPRESGSGYSGRGSSGRGGGRRWLRPRRILAIIALVVVVVLVLSGVMYFYLNSKLTRANVLRDYAAGRPPRPGRTGSSPGQTAARD